MLCLSVTVLITVLLGIGIDALEPQVTIPSGTVRGYFNKAFGGRNFASFEGVPYARPPVGKYRFREPQPLKPWKGVWIANQTTECLQYDHFTPRAEGNPGKRVIGQEDCLTLNIYTPQLSQTASLNVIVQIHGGAFIFGAGHFYGPKLLMDNDVVYVSLNYRLGPLGFLTTEDEVVPGNNGLKDQSLALKWIKENIQYFGGNPDKILLTGLSAGGASVTYHVISPMSTGLFTSAVAMSGSALNAWAFTENGLEKAKRVAASVGCDSISSRDMVDCMRYRSGKQIVSSVELFMPFLYNPFSPFGPVVEKSGLNPFLPDSPYNLIKQGKVNDVPLIISAVSEEGLYPAAEFQSEPTLLDEIEQRWDELAPLILDYNYTAPVAEHANIAQKIKVEYLGNKPISQETYPNLVQMIGDRLFVTTLETSAKLFARAMQSPVYFIYFTYRGEISRSTLLSRNTDNYGVCHADDLIYLFSSSWSDPIKTESDIQMKKLMFSLWSSFLNTGKPSLVDVQLSENIRPVSANKGSLDYLHIMSPQEVKMKVADTLSRRQFWNTLPFAENEITVQLKEEL